ncbi:hypothetical protein AAFF_G00120490 [Aldrovandia affinis]|uniref:C2H2-type domain-containing protein n=1 Tax=Aldrovandia affinis TaxID=143900 RepID=A0AAD7RS29_9TELE|nr:hypothetical protein AAFF_G00120490 [Aldrovandia affinis]
MRELKGDDEDPQVDGLSNDGLLAAMASLAQNLMTNPLLQITSPDSPKPPPMPSSPQGGSLKKKSDKNVKKKLREQILAGDLSRRGNLLHATSADANATLKNLDLQGASAGVHTALSGSQSSEPLKVIQMPPSGERGADINSSIGTSLPLTQSDGAMLMSCHTSLSGGTSQAHEASVSVGTVTSETDPGAELSSTDEDRKVIEIQMALEKLDLSLEMSEDTISIQVVNNPSSIGNASGSDAIPNNVEPVMPNTSVAVDVQVPDSFVKPFACENEGCNYRAMTKDALFKHLSKTHNYTDEMIAEIKKNHGKFAPFRCQMCSKTFTRNSNLRAHCQTVHSLSHEEMVKLKIKRQYNKKTEKVEVEVSNHQASGVRNNPTCVQSVTPLNHAASNESLLHQHVSADGRRERLDVPSVQNAVYGLDWMKQEYPSTAFEQTPPLSLAVPELSQDNCLPVGLPMQPTQGVPVNSLSAGGQAPPAVAMPGYRMEGQSSLYGPATEQCSHGQHLSGPSVPSKCLAGPQTGDFLPAGSLPLTQVSAGLPLPQAVPILAGSLSPDKTKKPKVSKPRITKPKIEKSELESSKKPIQKRPAVKNSEADEGFSPYRPYRCVHQGCIAAFTIQQNLILHYRAVHHSALPKFEENVTDDERHEQDQRENSGRREVKEEREPETSEAFQVNEFRCQVKDCSRIFQVVTSLLQHYLQLHKFTLDKAGALMSTISLGRFQCDQPGCPAFFTAFWKYIGHIEEDHKEAKVSKVEPVEGLYRCEVDGCDRGYATRSNLLRHTMKKHQDLYKLQLMKQRKNQEREKLCSKKSPLQCAVKNSNEKENVQDNKKVIQKGNDKKRSDEEKSNHWTKYGKPSLKSKEEASAMCTKKFPLQYPCMIKGCESVVSSERNILRHYIRHGLSERYLEEQRSHFIFCKKFSRSWYRDRSSRSEDSEDKSEDSSIEPSENDEEEEEEDDTTETGPRGSETEESSKPASAREEPELSDAKQSTDESSGSKSVASMVVKRKRGRPRKLHPEDAAPVAHRRVTERSRVTRSNPVNHAGDGSDSAPAPAGNAVSAEEKQPDQSVALNSFKPMGFEVSFLKFLEESTQPARPPKRKTSEDVAGEIALKRQHNIQLKTATVLCKRSDAYIQPRDAPNRIDFRNPQKLTSLRNVKIVVDQTFSKGTDRLLRQLQEMRPIVMLQK